VGVDLSWYTLPTVLREFELEVVFDVGANTGQYATDLRRAGYSGQIVSFEPLAEAHKVLLKKSATDASWTIAPRMAVGETNRTVEINVAANSYSSSLLKMAELHQQAAPDSAFLRTELVDMRTLDSVADTYLANRGSALLKLDVQGYEMRVLDGAAATMHRFNALQVEASTVELYEGEALVTQMIQRAESLGYALWSLTPGFIDRRNGRLLQVDCLFRRVPA
jgi:FkbM family methyltransferase